jgi:hypothetical protein
LKPEQPPPAGPATSVARPGAKVRIEEEPVRDGVGDLNAQSVRAGEFPGSFLIPGTGGVSFGIGGFIKALVFHDSNAEGREAVFLPALLGGVGRDDDEGTTSLSAELSRLHFDARVKVGESRLRGYIEFDFSGDLFKWRQGYLTWSGPFGEVLAGKSWSTFMDLQTLPDGLGEPTISGAIFTRQAQFRYSRAVSKLVKVAAAIEDSASNDVVAPEPVLTRNAYPDVIGTVTVGSAARHVQAGGLLRGIEFDPNSAVGDSATAWGLAVSGHTYLGKRDKIYGAFAYGDGLGRYMVGLAPAAGAFIDPDVPEVLPRENYGGFGGYRHEWNQACRSSVAYGYAKAKNEPRQPANAFTDSTFGLGNLLCRTNRFLTIGFEVDYGTRTNRDGSELDNLRLMFGMQLF